MDSYKENCTDSVRCHTRMIPQLSWIRVSTLALTDCCRKIALAVRRDKNFDDRASRSPLVMKTRGVVLQGLDLGKNRDAEHGTPLRLSMFDPMVDSRSITEGKDVAGMAE